MKTIKHQMAQAAAALSLDQGIATLQYRGLLSRRNSAEMIGVISGFLEVAGPGAMVSDYTGADVDQTARMLARAARPAIKAGPVLRLPGALIVRADELPLWRSYCYALGDMGAMRAAFTSAAEARAWAAENAALRAAQASYRARG